MGLTEADGGVVIGLREARRVLTSSSRISAGVGSRGSMEVSVPGPVFCHGTRMRHKVRVQKQTGLLIIQRARRLREGEYEMIKRVPGS